MLVIKVEFFVGFPEDICVALQPIKIRSSCQKNKSCIWSAMAEITTRFKAATQDLYGCNLILQNFK